MFFVLLLFSAATTSRAFLSAVPCTPVFLTKTCTSFYQTHSSLSVAPNGKEQTRNGDSNAKNIDAAAKEIKFLIENNPRNSLPSKVDAIRKACTPLIGTSIEYFYTAEMRLHVWLRDDDGKDEEKEVWIEDSNLPIILHCTGNNVLSISWADFDKLTVVCQTTMSCMRMLIMPNVGSETALNRFVRPSAAGQFGVRILDEER